MTFKDNTEYVSELWTDEEYPGTMFMTYYFDSEGIYASCDVLEDYLIRMGKIYKGETHDISFMELDVYGQSIYSVTVVLQEDYEIICKAEL